MRKNTVKKILAALLSLGVISALTACNNSQTAAQSTAVSSKSVSESSVESSQESSAESSSESSVESSKAVSENSAENSKESSKESSSESSVESSKAVSENSEESSDESSEIPVYEVEAKKASFDDVTRYGKVRKNAKLYVDDMGYFGTLLEGYLVAILKVNDSSYDLYWGDFSITVDSSFIELFDEDYKPDFSLRTWLGIEEKYLNL